jgi:exoribonuclease R
MKALRDPQNLLAEGLAAIRAQFRLPQGFAPEVLAAADAAAARTPDEHADWTERPFVTLDPASSTDLDQAFAIDVSGSDLLLHYAIADVAWFVRDGDPLDTEAWKRGATMYLPDGKASLYPPVLSEHAASLLPGGPRPAIVLSVRIAPDGAVRLDGATRALIRNRAKLAYETVTEAELPAGFAEFSRRMWAAEERRGAARVDPPEQEVRVDEAGHFALRFRPQLPSEQRNAALSLAANLAVADALLAAHTGLFRVMPEPDAGAEKRLRRTARAFHLDWPESMPLQAFEKQLRATVPPEAAFMLAVRRAGRGASYVPWRAGETPWHAAMAATYAHCTAPLRRLADRYVLRAVLAVVDGQPIPGTLTDAFERLPSAMARAESRDGQIERAVIDLAEVALLANHEGDVFPAVVTDIGENGARIQLSDLPVVARTTAHGVIPGAAIHVRLLAADPVQRRLDFQRVD